MEKCIEAMKLTACANWNMRTIGDGESLTLPLSHREREQRTMRNRPHYGAYRNLRIPFPMKTSGNSRESFATKLTAIPPLPALRERAGVRAGSRFARIFTDSMHKLYGFNCMNILLLSIITWMIAAQPAWAQTSPITEQGLEQRLARMTVREKIGQLNFCRITVSNIEAQVRAGEVGGLLNVRDHPLREKLERIAESCRYRVWIGGDSTSNPSAEFQIE